MFTSPEEFFETLQSTIIDRHPEDLSIVLNAYGIVDVEPTPVLLLALYARHGENFLRDLAAVLPEENASGLFGKLVDLFEKGKDIVTDIKGDNKTTPAPTETATDEKKPAKKFTTKKIVVIGLVIIVVLSIVVYFVTRKK